MAPSSRSGVLEELASLAGLDERVHRACPAVVLPAGSRRTAAELPAAHCYLVEDGTVLARSPGAGGRRSLILARCSHGALLTAPRGDEILQSLDDAWLTAIPEIVWQALLAVPAAAAWLTAKLEEALRRERDAALAFAGIRHVDRVRTLLLELARDHGRVCRDGVRIELPLTHELLGDMVGCSRETVTRAFEEFQREPFLARRGRYYLLLVEPKLLSA